ncbi:MAG: HAMP domain-containing histidine kinase [Clostridia bacterium]|nr:HAMP domain-containing histidine kinase [Clostridia bacterium]
MILDKELSSKFQNAGAVNIQFNMKTKKSTVIYSTDSICKDITINYIEKNHSAIENKFRQKTCSIYSDNIANKNISVYITIIPVFCNDEIETLCVFSDFTKNFFSHDELGNLLSMSNHDILNCLSVISMANDRILKDSDEKIQHYSSIIKDNIYKTIKYTNNTRDLISLYLGKKDKTLINTELSSFVKSHYNEIGNLIKDVEFEFKKDEICFAMINSPLLSSALLNIFSNAVKYKTKDSKIFVSFEKTYTYAKIIISNQVDCQDMQNIKKIFDYGYTTADGENIKGSGQGLYLVKKIAQYHDGKVSAKIKDGLFSITLSLPKSNIKLNRLSSYQTAFNIAHIRAYFDKM